MTELLPNKMIVTDVDGTLLKDGTLDLNPEYYDQLRRLSDSGYNIVICSGRGFSSLERLFEPILDRLYFIADGGTIIRTHDEVLRIVDMPDDIWQGMCDDIEKLRSEGCDYFIATPDVCFAKDEDSYMFHWMKDSYQMNVQKIDDLDTIKDLPVVKLSIFHKEDSERVCSEWYIPKWKDKAQIVCAGKEWTDCINKDANKGAAVRWLQEYLHVDRNNTHAFGDNNNDIPMLEAAANSYAVENAKDEVKSVASHVIPSYTEDGVLNVLKKLN